MSKLPGNITEPVDAEAEELKALIAKEQARIDAAEAASRQGKTEALRATLAEKKREADEAELTAKAVAEFGAQGRAWDMLQTGPRPIVVARPNHMHFKRWSDNGAKDTTAELEKLTKPSLKYLTWEEFQSVIEEEPATLARAANIICRLAGFRKEDLAGK